MILFFFIFFLSGNGEKVNEVKLTTAPSTPKKIKLVESLTILDDPGFYKSIDTSVSPDGKIVILDRGNYQINVYNKQGKLLNRFGNQGEGPGELSGAGHVFAFNDRVLIKNWSKVIIFDYQGRLIKEVKEPVGNATLFQTPSGYQYVFDEHSASQILSKSFNKNGEILTEIPNKNFHKSAGKLPKDEKDYYLNINKYMKQEFNTPYSFKRYKNGYMRCYSGDYRIEILNQELVVQTVLTREYKRPKYKWEDISKNTALKRLPKAQREEQINRYQKRRDAYMLVSDGYDDAIDEILGEYNGYIFVSLKSEKNQKFIDVISPEFELVGTIDLYALDIKNMDEFDWALLSNNHLVLEMNSLEYGPYVKIFDVQLLSE